MVHRQMTYILNKDIGFNKTQVLMIQGSNTLEDRIPMFQDEISQLAGVESSSVSNYYPVKGTKRDQNSFFKEGRKQLDAAVGAQMWRADENYLNTLGIRLAAGRMFESDRAADSSSIVINQRMAKALALDEPLGARIENHNRVWNVVGVMEDFHFDNLRYQIRPLAIARTQHGEIVTAKLQTQDMAAILADITRIWDEFMPNQPIRYTFMDESFTRMYADVQRTASVFTAFAALAIIVACLGLFGLSAFMAEQRTKEISIHKVLGASLNKILLLLTRNFILLIIIALVVAIPTGSYLMREWLSAFEYRVPLSWDVFLIAGLLVVLIAIVTISFESIKAVLINPIKGLRSE